MLTEDVTIEMDDDMPLCLGFKENGSMVKFYLAPKIQD
jgi:hypothetical protein